ncbi:MAG: cobyrinic acid ac-diamide synthase, chromosome partitioning protein [Parcubacteria group bacterium GW2011_GWC1_43_12]|nr:MAG: Chromosome segregation ATPase [Parcubacteria group bacterium GW2011_GWB1_42_6]KKS92570.1 MAG: cobyrinic acid ac-diamide synthase, chromosome partitioning protein [Parcubacteria group bacterium GW2011_GWC1_43_12]
MAKIISVVNQKGGTGKTTTTTNLAAYLAAMGKYVLLVDLDPQANATSGLGFEPDNLEKHLYHAFSDEFYPEDIIRRTNLFGYDIMPSNGDLAGAAIELVGTEEREFKLYNILHRVRTNYDYILIDCPPSLGLLTINGLTAADEIVVPVQCEYYALEGLGQLIKTVNLIQDNLGRDLKIKGALLTMHDPRNNLSRQVAKEIRLHFPGYVFESEIPRCVRLAEAPSFGKTIFQYDPDSKGGRAYRQLAEELIRLDSVSAKIDPAIRP